MKREHCKRCLHPLVTCFCEAINSYNTKINILILQSPKENKHHLSTAIMAKLSFPNVTIIQGENFSQNKVLNSLDKETSFLLYPKNEPIKLSKNMDSKKIETIIVLDGTWKKTYKMYQLSKNLHSFKTIAFYSSPESHLQLRKAPKDYYLSTYESIVYSIECIEKITLKNYESPLKCIQEKIDKLISIKGELNEISN